MCIGKVNIMKIANKLMALKEIKAEKKTENGDIAYTSTGNHLIDLLFMAEYFQNHLDEVHIGTSDKEKLFAMYMRDARFGKGYRDYGRTLMEQAGNTPDEIITAGRFDDLYHILNDENLNRLFEEVKSGNPLAKKWMPRLTGKDAAIAKLFAQAMGISYKEYRKLIKTDETVEYKLSYAEPKENASVNPLSQAFNAAGYPTDKESNYDHPLVDTIDFEKVPSLAMTKYFGAFSRREDTKERFGEYLNAVKDNKAKVNTATTTVRDAHRIVSKTNANIEENADILGKKIVEDNTKGLSLNAICVFDSSASMTWGGEGNDIPYDNALAVAHAVATNSSYAKNQVISFSSHPKLMAIKGNTLKEQYRSMHTGDCSNTDLGKVFDILSHLKEYPEYLIILSDMEFDSGSNFAYRNWKEKVKASGAKTKLIWWNFNQRNRTSPEFDKDGNIYMSGYDVTSLMLLPGVMDMDEYIDTLLKDYAAKIN